jgi:hypothetical protein
MGRTAYAVRVVADVVPTEAKGSDMGLFNRKKDASTQVIDLRDPKPAKPKWGSPVPCPECSGRGYLDHIDPFKEIMFLHCTMCLTKYEVARAELADDSSDAFTV